ncbi:MAG: UvrD-helicase domain-containing protein [Phycisphaerae bacterium]|nr:UvrD-helicase domain-containing protein [Phycisphaerae bacterium]
MSAPLSHLRILASAGSGKTFRLSGRMIDLFRRVRDPGTVLASTFTRAAAAEIRDRVLRRLADAALSAQDRETLVSGSALAPPSEREAVALLERVARDPDRLQIRTLDSFFAAGVMAFGPELGLPASMRVVDPAEEAALRDDAIGQLLAGPSANEVVATLHALTRGHPCVRVASEIARAVSQVASFGRDALAGAWDWPPRAAPSTDRADVLRQRLERTSAANSKAIESVIVKDRAALRDAAFDDLEVWTSILNRGIGPKVVTGESTFSRVDIPGDVYALYSDLVAYAYDVAYAEYSRRTAATGRLVDAFNAAFAVLKRERGLVTFEDLVFAIADKSTRPDEDELFFRLDGRISHLLLDEFQDTSAVQWRAIRPIVDEITASDAADRSFFVVGDLKQSIYGWRGALPEILGQIESLIRENGSTVEIDDESMFVSYRSSPVVLKAVDDIFLPFASNPGVPTDVVVSDAVESWLGYCEPHQAHATSLPGRVELHFSKKAGRANSREQSAATLEDAAQLIHRMHREHAGASIGVLTRRNAPVSHLLNRLRSLGVAASARGVGSLLDAAPVNALIDALVFADHPDDTIACFHVAHSPLGELLGLHGDDHQRERTEARHECSRAIRYTLEKDGFAATLRSWSDRIAGSVDAREADRIALLIELSSAYDGVDGPLRSAEVALALRSTDLDQPGGGSVSIMTIHQSKGLEFDAVVLCDLDQPFSVKPALAAVRQGLVGPYERLLRWPPEALRNADPEWQTMAALMRSEQYREFLSLLYVATTRAKQMLVAVVAPPTIAKDGSIGFSTSFASILRGAWAPTATEPGCVYTNGDPHALAASAVKHRDTGSHAGAGAGRPVHLKPASGLRALRAASASARADSPQRVPGEVIDAERGAAIDRGVAYHAMLERVRWVEHGLPSEDEFVAAGLRAIPRAEPTLLRAIARSVTVALARPEISRLFALPATPIELLREWPYVRLDREGRIESGTIDRVVLDRSGDRVTGARIIDFKTEATDEADSTGRAQRYRVQLEAYRTAICERFAVDPSRVSACVAFVEAGVVVTLPG